LRMNVNCNNQARSFAWLTRATPPIRNEHFAQSKACR
jgi:hypothetical protein